MTFLKRSGFEIVNYIYTQFFGLRFLLLIFIYSLAFHSNAQTFEVYADDNRVKVHEQNDVPSIHGLSSYKFARITYIGKPIGINIQSTDLNFNHSEWSISPKRYKIKGEKSGNQLSFKIDRLGYVVIRLKQNQDFTKRLVLLFEAPELVPENRINIVDFYDVDNSGEKNETSKIQRALDDISGTENVLYFPPGKYKSYKLEFRSNSRIHLNKNARIIADDHSLSSYISDDKTKINHFILIKDVQNLQISGLGTLDGNGTQINGLSHPDQSIKIGGMRLLLIYRSRNIQIEGIILKDAGRWNTHILNSEHISFRYCKLMNNPAESKYLGSLDGWDPDSSSDILIENSFGWAGDDTVAIKCTGWGENQEMIPNAERITIRNNVFLTKKSALKIGTETYCELMQNIIFENNDIIESDRVLGINVRDGASVKEVLFKNIYADHCHPDRKQTAINFYITKRNRYTSSLGKIQNITIEDCNFEEAFANKLAFFRYYSETKKKDLSVHLKNVFIGGKKIEEIDTNFFDPEKNNAELSFN